MKTLALFLMTGFLTATSVITFGETRATVTEDAATFVSGCDGPKQEEKSNGVQVRLEICGNDLDGYDIDASNPSTGKKFDCKYNFTLTGTKREGSGSVSISREKTITVSSTATGWFNAHGESGIKEGKDFKISSFSVSCSES
ncbi:MAG TPA: hypothetical protein VNA22_04850 [Pyrinomonadaceae bacterium]|nr:hypothetical protein [Pyrinomonadaceae bacterium]